MTVRELIEKLKEFPEELIVEINNEGELVSVELVTPKLIGGASTTPYVLLSDY